MEEDLGLGQWSLVEEIGVLVNLFGTCLHDAGVPRGCLA